MSDKLVYLVERNLNKASAIRIEANGSRLSVWFNVGSAQKEIRFDVFTYESQLKCWYLPIISADQLDTLTIEEALEIHEKQVKVESACKSAIGNLKTLQNLATKAISDKMIAKAVQYAKASPHNEPGTEWYLADENRDHWILLNNGFKVPAVLVVDKNGSVKAIHKQPRFDSETAPQKSIESLNALAADLQVYFQSYLMKS